MAVSKGALLLVATLTKRKAKGEITKTPISLQDLRKSLYVRRRQNRLAFWGLYVHVCKMETSGSLQMANSNDGAPGIDGVTLMKPSRKWSGEFSETDSGQLVQAHVSTMRVRKRRFRKTGPRSAFFPFPLHS